MTPEKSLVVAGEASPSAAQINMVALATHDAGLCPVPPRQDGSKAPIGEWGKYQRKRPPRQRIKAWYGPHTGVGVVCGQISGNLECLEFDDPAVYYTYKGLAEVLAWRTCWNALRPVASSSPPQAASTGCTDAPKSLATRSWPAAPRNQNRWATRMIRSRLL